MSGDEFMARGLCAQTDPEAFFPEKGSPPARPSDLSGLRGALGVSAYALAHDERHGVWVD